MTVDQYSFLDEVGTLLGQALLLLARDGSVLAYNRQARHLLPGSILTPPHAERAQSVFAGMLEPLCNGSPTTPIESCLEVPGTPPLRCRAMLNAGPPPTVLVAIATVSSFEPASFGPEVLSILNHEFRTPLATLCGFAELMLNREFDEATKRTFLETIRGESFRLAHLFKNLIDLQRVRSRDFSLHLETVEFETLVERACSQRRSEPDRSIELRLPSRSIAARLDPVRMSRVLDILLENAFRLCDQARPLKVSLSTSSQKLFLSVRAPGSGIPVEAAQEIFVASYRPRQTDWPRLDGFSLPLAKSIVEAHGGRIWVETEAAEATVLNFSLPLGGTAPNTLTLATTTKP